MTCFDYRAQKVIWSRKDIIGIQTVNISTALPNSVFLTLEAPDYRMSDPSAVSGIAELDSLTGKTNWVSSTGHWLYLHPNKPILVVQDGGPGGSVRILTPEKKELGKIKMVHFSIIDVGFSGDLIALAEGSKGVRVIDFKGRLVSSYVPRNREPYFVAAAFDDGKLRAHDSWDGAFIVTIDPASGKLLSEYKRTQSGDVCFIDDGKRFVTSRGEICLSSDGTVQSALKA